MSKLPKDSPPKSAEVPAQLYDAHDPIPVPEVSELDSESIWALFPGSEAASRPKPDTDPFGETVAAPLKP
jgi:hypothetical protein